MEISQIKVKNLSEFIDSPEFRISRVIPISRLRAISQYHNPSSEAEDIALIISYDEQNEILGYIGILPGYLIKGEKKIKIYWNSGWWVNPVKGRNVAMQLFYLMMESCKDLLLFPDLTLHTSRLMKQTGYFYFPAPKPGIKGIMRVSFHNYFSVKNRIPEPGLIALRMVDKISDLVVSCFQFIYSLIFKTDKSLTYIEVDKIDTEVADLISKTNSNKMMFRSLNELNWVIQYPWVRIGDFRYDNEAKKYFFSTVANEFQNHLLKVNKDGILIAFIFLSSHNRNYKVPYLFTCRDTDDCLKVIYQFLIRNKALSFITWNSFLIRSMKRIQSPFIIKKKITKQEAYSKELTEIINDSFKLQDGDGDMVFT
jgi:hypothetical protein